MYLLRASETERLMLYVFHCFLLFGTATTFYRSKGFFLFLLCVFGCVFVFSVLTGDLIAIIFSSFDYCSVCAVFFLFSSDGIIRPTRGRFFSI